MVETLEAGEPGRVNIRVPLQLLRAGVRLTALVPPQALERANAEMSKSGVPFDPDPNQTRTARRTGGTPRRRNRGNRPT
ncbi:hypothetical protein [Fodinicola feengrottensis]|uniref:hypothetical protein n=1 Tax=Fodinicola feengrottensis TaxID=435914 RepID=UPI00244147F3|nr:hypothetical protein [Fodinicola feengrottensis]